MPLKPSKTRSMRVPAPEESFIDQQIQDDEPQLLVPEDQLELSEADLNEDSTRVLSANDPNVTNNIVLFHFGDREFKAIPPGSTDNTAFHLSLDGPMLHKDSEEAKAQETYEKYLSERAEEKKRYLEKEFKTEEVGDEFSLARISGGKNQFEYSERATQTFNMSIRSRGITTTPPETRVFGDTMSQWEAYDAFVREYERQVEEAEENGGQAPSEEKSTRPRTNKDLAQSEAVSKSLKVLERMVNQNAEDEIVFDFKFWEDESDRFRGHTGSLLPLWRFSDPRTRKKQVTAIAFNPKYPDMFAVGFGSYDFMKQGSGYICVYTLKSTSHPEYSFSTDSGVMSLDFHPQHPSLLAVGCYDGNVMVFDVRRKENAHLFVSDIRSGKHTDPVWEVHWQPSDVSKGLSFYSISLDGKVANWVVSKNELNMEVLMTLRLVSTGAEEPDDETSLTGLASGTCFAFNSFNEHMFLVGTEEGKVHLCSKAYSGQYLKTFAAHNMGVYAVKWNPYHRRVFLSSSADWTVKLWDHDVTSPIMTFDLGNPVGDIGWAPYSSTVFAAVTNDGRVHVYDLTTNKHDNLCDQKVVKRAKLTHITFSDKDPLILVGDDRGAVNSLKLSPNLRQVTPLGMKPAPKPAAAAEAEEEKSEEETKTRKQGKETEAMIPMTREEVEVEKLSKILNSADIQFD